MRHPLKTMGLRQSSHLLKSWHERCIFDMPYAEIVISRWKQTSSRLDICKLAQLTITSKLKADGMVWRLLIVTCYEQKQKIHRYLLFHKKSLCYNAFVERSIYWVKCVCKVINVLSNATKMTNIEAQQHINRSKTDLGLICCLNSIKQQILSHL